MSTKCSFIYIYRGTIIISLSGLNHLLVSCLTLVGHIPEKAIVILKHFLLGYGGNGLKNNNNNTITYPHLHLHTIPPLYKAIRCFIKHFGSLYLLISSLSSLAWSTSLRALASLSRSSSVKCCTFFAASLSCFWYLT